MSGKGADVIIATGRMSVAPLEGHRRGIDEPRALAARSSIASIVVRGKARVGEAAGSFEGDFLEAGLRGDLLGAGGGATGNSDPVGILPPTPDEDDVGRTPASLDPEEAGREVPVGIAETAKEEEFREEQV